MSTTLTVPPGYAIFSLSPFRTLYPSFHMHRRVLRVALTLSLLTPAPPLYSNNNTNTPALSPSFSYALFGYTAAALLSTVVLLTGQSIAVARFRAAAGVEYPRQWADKEEVARSPAALRFNCVQHAHQYTVERIAGVYLMTVLLGVRHPRVAAGALAAWVVGRAASVVGYASGDARRRDNLVTALTFPGVLSAFFPPPLFSFPASLHFLLLFRLLRVPLLFRALLLVRVLFPLDPPS
ncbi:hypothetical protein DFH09DRAFT_1358514 [Mycena vulgaris]|nr:hypothetical protein DFH09DRAFT_1358514 [Mycena vulgaris]